MDVREQGEEWCMTNTHNDSRYTQDASNNRFLINLLNGPNFSFFQKCRQIIQISSDKSVLAAVHNLLSGFYRLSSTYKVSKPNISTLLTPLSPYLNCYYIPKAIIFQLFVLTLIVYFTHDDLILANFSSRRQQTNTTVGSFHFKYSKIFGWYARLCRSNTRLCWKLSIFQASYSNLNILLTLHGVWLKGKVWHFVFFPRIGWEFRQHSHVRVGLLLISCLKLF